MFYWSLVNGKPIAGRRTVLGIAVTGLIAAISIAVIGIAAIGIAAIGSLGVIGRAGGLIAVIVAGCYEAADRQAHYKNK